MSKIVLVTGGSRGIGASICLEFAKNGYDIALNYNKSLKEATGIKTKIEELGQTCLLYQADISNYSEVENMIQTILRDFKTIDVLVNNAGIANIKQINDEDEKSINYIISTNLLGCIYTSKFCSEVFISKKCGNIINISSILGEDGSSCESVYCASKGGIIAFTKALAKELGPSNIKVNCVLPGYIDTEMNKDIENCIVEEIKTEIPLQKIGKPEDVSKVVVFLASDKNNYIHGSCIRVDGGWTL